MRAMIAFCSGLQKNEVSVENIPIFFDDPVRDLPENYVPPSVLIQCEDFGGNLTCPLYLAQRPSIDYYSSNLLLHLFVIANHTENKNHAYLYDERGAGKGGNEVCSLRFVYHLKKWIERRELGHQQYESCVLIMDNCVGQNKSHVCMLFGCLLSLLFYKRVVFFYLPSGHSHMAADRVVAWVRAALKRRCGFDLEGNLYVPQQYVDLINTLKSVKGEFLDHNSPSFPMFTGWEDILHEHLQPIPSDIPITKHYVYEFQGGVALLKENCYQTDNYRAHNFLRGLACDVVRSRLMRSIFGPGVSMDNCTVEDIQLGRCQLRELPSSKLTSFAEKLDTIPAKHLWYYPTVNGITAETTVSNSNKRVLQQKVEHISAVKIPRLLRPPEQALVTARTPHSITKYFPMLKQTPKSLPMQLSLAPLSLEPSPVLPLQLQSPVLPLQLQSPVLPLQLQSPVLPLQLQSPLQPLQLQSPVLPFQLQSPVLPLQQKPLVPQLRSPAAQQQQPVISPVVEWGFFPPAPVTVVEPLHSRTETLVVRATPEELHGFRWARNSCALDTVCTVFYQLYLECTEEEKIAYAEDMPFFAEQFNAIKQTQPATWTKSKDELIRVAYSWGNVRNKFGEFVSITEIMDSLVANCLTDKSASPFLDLHYRTWYSCHRVDGTTARTLPRLHRGMSVNWRLSEYQSFQECINHNFHDGYVDPVLICNTKHCDRHSLPALRIKKALNTPGILWHMFDWFPPQNFLLEDRVNFNGHTYGLFAGLYKDGLDGNHFVARIRRCGRVYYYDGMMNRAVASSKCTLLPPGSNIPPHIAASDGGPLCMIGFMYKMLKEKH